MRISLNSLSFLFFASINAFFVLLLIYFISQGWFASPAFAFILMGLWLIAVLAAIAVSEYIEKLGKRSTSDMLPVWDLCKRLLRIQPGLCIRMFVASTLMDEGGV